MQSLLTFLIQLSGKAWAAIMVALICAGAVSVYCFSPASAGSDSDALNQPASAQVEHLGGFGRGGTPDHHNGSVPVVPEANAGVTLIPVIAALLILSSRRLWPAKPARAAADRRTSGRD
jgi:hypothetical protein